MLKNATSIDWLIVRNNLPELSRFIADILSEIVTSKCALRAIVCGSGSMGKSICANRNRKWDLSKIFL